MNRWWTRLKLASKYVLGMFFVLAGVMHFRAPEFYLKIMPPYVPWHLELVYLSGVFEVLLGAMLLVPATTNLAAWGLIALLIAVFPANLHMALNTDQYSNISPILLWLRLPLQGLLIA